VTHARDFDALNTAQAVMKGLLTVCRECRDEMPVFSTNVPAAEFVIWGKLSPPEALGPKCHDHAVKWLGHHVGYRSSQYAVVDLRPAREWLNTFGNTANDPAVTP